MAVPKKKTSPMKRDHRRSHHALEKTNAIPCGSCGAPTLSHRVCPSCNQYNGKVVLKVED